MKVRSRTRIPAGLTLIIALLIGCDLFRTREAEPPESGRSTWETPRVPQDVLNNLASALFERNVVNYMLAFDSARFTFEADFAAQARDPTLRDWTYEDEYAHVTRLQRELPKNSHPLLLFTNSQETILGDSAQIRIRYSLAIEDTVDVIPDSMAGVADFTLHISRSGYWQIFRWKDNRTEEQSTWSDLKSALH